jgi:hypothetical protein
MIVTGALITSAPFWSAKISRSAPLIRTLSAPAAGPLTAGTEPFWPLWTSRSIAAAASAMPASMPRVKIRLDMPINVPRANQVIQIMTAHRY